MDNNILERLGNSGSGLHPGDASQWTQATGHVPDHIFAHAAAQAGSQLSPDAYASHIQPAHPAAGPLSTLPAGQRTDLAQSILSALLNAGVNQGQVANGAGVSSTDPAKMSPTDLSSLLQWVQQSHPQVLGDVATQYRSQPSILSAILGNKALMALVMSLGAKVVSDQMGHHSGAPSGSPSAPSIPPTGPAQGGPDWQSHQKK